MICPRMGGGGRQSTGIWHPECPQGGKFDPAAIQNLRMSDKWSAILENT